jgi:3-dehydrosphinganine reductase
MSFIWIISSAVLALLIAAAAMPFFSSNKMPVEGKTALITGASEGLGLCVARMLSEKGANIIIVSRTASKLENALKTIAAAAKDPEKQRFHYIAVDVGTAEYSDAVFAEATEWNGGAPPDIVWCVAGISMPGIFRESPMWSVRRQMDVNFYGQAEMAHTALRVWCDKNAPVEKEPKHFIFTTSVASFLSVAGYSPYSPSKWAVRGLADALAQEVLLYPQKVEIHVVAPATMLTACTEIENRTKPEVLHLIEKDDPIGSAEDTAKAAIQGLENGDYMIAHGLIPSAMKFGVLGGIRRNNWVLDTIFAMLTPLVYIYYVPVITNIIRKYQREHDHPSTYAKQPNKE